MNMEASPAAAEASAQALKIGLLVQHLRQNNVAYLLAVLIAHTMGLLTPVIAYGQGMCS